MGTSPGQQPRQDRARNDGTPKRPTRRRTERALKTRQEHHDDEPQKDLADEVPKPADRYDSNGFHERQLLARSIALGDIPINPTQPPLPPNPPVGWDPNLPWPPGPPITVTVTDIADPKQVNPDDPWPEKAAEGAFSMAYWKMRGWGVPRFLAWLISGAAGVVIGIMGYAVAGILWAFKTTAPSVGLFFLKGIADMRKSVDPAIPEMAADILTELTGANIKAGDLPQGQSFADHLARVTATGSELHNLLEKEFAPNGVVSPDQGAQAARAFTGFNINFGIGTAMIAILGEIESLGQLEQFRELGVEVARNLGLGRLHRLALQPLIKTMIADPYLAHLNTKYTPKLLPKEQAIKAWWRGVMSEPQMRKELAEEGYSTARQDFMIADSRPMLSDRELIHLGFRHFIEDAEMRKELQKRGWKAEDLDKVIESERPQPTANDFLELYLSGWIERADMTIALEQLGYRPDAAEVIIKAFDMKHFLAPHPKHPPAPHRTFNQLRKEFLDGVITLTEVQNQLSMRGYNDDDITAMTLDLLLDQQGRRATRATRAVPSLTWAQLKAAFKSGVVDLEEVKVHLTHRGYSADDIAVLVKELSPPPASTATPTA